MTPRLLRRPRSHDRAFERLYRRHAHDVYRYTLAVLHNEADAEDVTQAAFLNAYRAFQRGDRPLKPHNWLIKIAHNECRQRFRASARRPQEVEFRESDVQTRPGADEGVPTADEIRHALAQLSFNQRAVLVMRELEGRSYAEMASILETSVGAVETLLFRARRAIREQLEGGLACGEVEILLARGADGSKGERAALRAHLRECKECATLERRQRAQRAALRTAFRYKGTALVAVVTDPNALSIPPKIRAEMVTGFALSARCRCPRRSRASSAAERRRSPAVPPSRGPGSPARSQRWSRLGRSRPARATRRSRRWTPSRRRASRTSCSRRCP